MMVFSQFWQFWQFWQNTVAVFGVQSWRAPIIRRAAIGLAWTRKYADLPRLENRASHPPDSLLPLLTKKGPPPCP